MFTWPRNALLTCIGDQRRSSKVVATKPASKKTKPASGRAKKAKIADEGEEED
jgi:hypothetical protein